MTKIHFFTDEDKINEQGAHQAYGPVENEESKKYQVTALFSAKDQNDPPNAYAPYEGKAIIVPSEKNDRINIFLIPGSESNNNPGIPRVKYFVFRGIKKEDYIKQNQNGNDEVQDENQTTSNMVKDLHDENGHEVSNFENHWNNLMKVADDQDYLSHLWGKDDFKCFDVKQGEVMGTYDASDGFGFEIMLEEMGFEPDMKTAKKDVNIVDANSGSDKENELERLKVLRYVDPAAFYGIFIQSGGYLIRSSANGDIQGSNIYTQFLDKFYTKNRVYIDIRNSFELPIDINFAGNEADFIRIRTDGNQTSSSDESNFRYFDNGNVNVWPIHILEGSQFSSGNHLNPDVHNYRYFPLQIGFNNLSNLDEPITHLITHHLRSSWIKSSYDHKQAYSYLDIDNGWSNDLELSTFATRNIDNMGNVNTASYIRILLTDARDKERIKNQVIDNKYHKFSPIEFTNEVSPYLARLPETDDIAIEEEGIASLHGQNFYSVVRDIGVTLRRGTAVDSHGCVHFALRAMKNVIPENFEVDIKNTHDGLIELQNEFFEEKSFYKALTRIPVDTLENILEDDEENQIDQASDYIEKLAAHNYNKQYKRPLDVHKVQFNDGTESIDCLEPRLNDPVILGPFDHTNSRFEPLLSIAYSQNERAAIETLIDNNFEASWYTFFKITGIEDFRNSGERRVIKAHNSGSYKLEISGLIWDGSTLKLDTIGVGSNLVFYSIDGLNFVTKEYASQYEDKVLKNDILPDFQNSNDNPFPSGFVNDFHGTLNDNFRGSNNGNSYGEKENDRILFGKIRDYFYRGDLRNLTFEMAFRLPFFTENEFKVPYTEGAEPSSTLKSDYPRTLAQKKVNNPFIEKFNGWFEEANKLRSTYGQEINELNRTGASVDFDPLSRETFNMFGFTRDSLFENEAPGDILINENVAAYMAEVMHDENSLKWEGGYQPYPHLPGGDRAQTRREVKIKLGELDELENENVITSNTKNALMSAAAQPESFVFTIDIEQKSSVQVSLDSQKYSDNPNGHITLNLSHTKFLYSKENTTDFFIGSGVRLTTASGVTLGFGFDMPRRSFSEFKKYTPYNSQYDPNWQSILEGEIKEVRNESVVDTSMKEVNKLICGEIKFGGNSATDVLNVFWEVMWKKLKFPYSSAIPLTKPFWLDRLKEADNNIARNASGNVLITHPITKSQYQYPSYFFKGSNYQYINEVEKFIMMSICINLTPSHFIVNSSSGSIRRSARYFVHAFNTHSINTLVEGISKTMLYSGRKTTLKSNLENKEMIKHFKIR